MIVIIIRNKKLNPVFWKEITKEELPSPTYSNHVTWDWNDVDRLLELEVDYDASADDTVVGDDNTPPDDAAKVDKNRKRRLNEAERLQKYSWDRVERPDDGKKRARYDYINRTSGETVTSLRQALQQCRASSKSV